MNGCAFNGSARHCSSVRDLAHSTPGRLQRNKNNIYIRVRVKERIITVPGQAIGQGSGPRPWVVTCGGGGGGGGSNSLQTP